MSKTIFITGATDGIGKAMIEPLLNLGFTVLIHGRDLEKVNSTIKEFNSDEKLRGYVSDLFNFQEIKLMCEQILQNENKIDVIVHNAGTYEKKLIFNSDSVEKTFAVNFVSNVLINEKLLSLIKKDFQLRKEKKEFIKIIFVSSIAHQSGVYHLSEWISPNVFNGYKAYANSKMAQIMYGYWLAREWEKYNVLVNSIHPGVIDTKLLRENFKMKGSPLSSGIRNQFYLITSEEPITGKYINDLKEAKSSPETYNEEYQKELYETTKNIIQKYL